MRPELQPVLKEATCTVAHGLDQKIIKKSRSEERLPFQAVGRAAPCRPLFIPGMVFTLRKLRSATALFTFRVHSASQVCRRRRGSGSERSVERAGQPEVLDHHESDYTRKHRGRQRGMLLNVVQDH